VVTDILLRKRLSSYKHLHKLAVVVGDRNKCIIIVLESNIGGIQMKWRHGPIVFFYFHF